MEGPVLMECYEDVFEEIASKFYADDPLAKSLLSGDPFMRFGSRLRTGAASLLSPQYLLNNGISPPDNGRKTSSPGDGSTNSPSDDTWIESPETLSWSNSKVARYNPSTKMYKCVDCETVGFLSRIAEHWLGTHANLKVFRCPRCPYSSAWARCVRMHLTRHHNEQHSDASLWKDNPALDEVTQLLQNLRHNAESQNATSDGESGAAGPEGPSDKRYACPQCPYATDRRDLYTRHENIHKDEKPFHCYICYKMFSRADHVKKHFFRMHKDRPYDIHLIRRLPVKSPNHNDNTSTTNNTNPANSSSDAEGSGPVYYNGCSSQYAFPIRTTPNGSTSKTTTSTTTPTTCRVRTSTANYEARFVVASNKRHLPKMFSCTYCSWRGVDNWCLKRHLNTHIKPYLCVLCDYKAARAERLSTHVLKIHNKRICNKCSFLAEDQIQLNRHARDAHHDRQVVKCEDCPETFEGPSELETHGIMVHNKDLLDCEHCDYKTTHRTNLERHNAERHLDQAKPAEVVTNGTKKDIRCQECGCEFANQASLQTHMLLLHRSERDHCRSSSTYMCSLCQYGCSTQATMMEHMRVHTGEVLHCRAEDCNFRTPFDSVLREHVEYLHDDEFIVRCPHCGFSLSSRHSFNHHYPVHHPRLCLLCVAVIRKHFPSKNGGSLDGNGIQNPDGTSKENVSYGSQVDLRVVTQLKRPRKQSKPRKIIQTDDDDDDENVFDGKASPKLKRRMKSRNNFVDNFIDEDSTECPFSSMKRRSNDNNNHLQDFDDLPTDLSSSSSKLKRRRSLTSPAPQTPLPPQPIKHFSFAPQFRCRQCRPSLSFSQKKNWLLHTRWNHNRKQFKCEHCMESYTHQYQVLLHASRAHVLQRI